MKIERHCLIKMLKIWNILILSYSSDLIKSTLKKPINSVLLSQFLFFFNYYYICCLLNHVSNKEVNFKNVYINIYEIPYLRSILFLLLLIVLKVNMVRDPFIEIFSKIS